MESNVTVVVRCIICCFNVLGIRLDVICKLETLQFVIQVKVAYISNKPLLVVEHAFPLNGFVGLSALATIACTDQVSFGPVPILMVVKII